MKKVKAERRVSYQVAVPSVHLGSQSLLARFEQDLSVAGVPAGRDPAVAEGG